MEKQERYRQKILSGVRNKTLFRIPASQQIYHDIDFITTRKGNAEWKKYGVVSAKHIRYEIWPSGGVRAVRWK